MQKDLIVVTLPGAISDSTAKRMKEFVQEELGDGVHVLVIGEGARVDRIPAKAYPSDRG